MDFQNILADKIKALPAGDHTNGLKAVRIHIETAVRHYLRGQSDNDETMFTDAIYRCNQAYEGSIKEAYRVLANKAPDRKTPAHIEEFLTEGNVLRKKLLDQLTRYRTEWRNPSAHDYILDFDEDEALLAIGSVTALAIVLCDQIDGKLASNAAEMASAAIGEMIPNKGSLLDQIADGIMQFCENPTMFETLSGTQSNVYSHLEGTLAGFLKSSLSENENVDVQQGARLQNLFETDILVQNGDDKIAIEVKLQSRASSYPSAFERGILQLERILMLGELSGGVLVIYSPNARKYAVTSIPGRVRGLRVVAPITAF
jgi:hypothetical protein